MHSLSERENNNYYSKYFILYLQQRRSVSSVGLERFLHTEEVDSSNLPQTTQPPHKGGFFSVLFGTIYSCSHKERLEFKKSHESHDNTITYNSKSQIKEIGEDAKSIPVHWSGHCSAVHRPFQCTGMAYEPHCNHQAKPEPKNEHKRNGSTYILVFLLHFLRKCGQ